MLKVVENEIEARFGEGKRDAAPDASTRSGYDRH
jgi:hypothetical protein